MKIWGGRFSEGMDEAFERFNRSLSVDHRLILEDIEGSIAYAKALEKAGLLSADELNQIGRGLSEIKKRVDKGTDWIRESLDEDVHSFVEARLVELIGEAAYKR